MTQVIDNIRRSPSQTRATNTAEMLFEAAARIVEQGETGRLTTNHIAERAGYSVGTLYGYFPNKQSLLRAMALREIRRQEASALAALKSVRPGDSEADIIRIVIHAALRPFGARSRLRLGLMRMFMADPDVLRATKTIQEEILNMLFAILTARDPASSTLSSGARFIMLASVTGTIQQAVHERADLFETKAFEDDLVAMIAGFLKRA